eukprot:CAMPEP_0181492752 /NCGR_PEP_ID=MMETSP1110-20121109/50857_1 /TAXON_ID=174948 /ORGANISM="Symbiodinium sp., Strain CCMP421" /LENGTH=79 /DNA_ID=CAMNT_0023620021 /DNA_START=244 /DNA_END=483 /DNA_ORIENTATION=+
MVSLKAPAVGLMPQALDAAGQVQQALVNEAQLHEPLAGDLSRLLIFPASEVCKANLRSGGQIVAATLSDHVQLEDGVAT